MLAQTPAEVCKALELILSDGGRGYFCPQLYYAGKVLLGQLGDALKLK